MDELPCLRLENCAEVSQHIKEANDVIEWRELFDKLSCCYLA
jgi:hypothetical protein